MWHASFPHVMWLLLMLPLIWWSMRGLPRVLPRWRVIGVLITRHLMFAVLLLSLAGIGWARLIPRNPVIIYLVDRSASMDPREQQWQQEQLLQLDAQLAPHAERVLMTFAERARALRRWPAGEPMPREVVMDATQDPPSRVLGAFGTNLQAAVLTGLSLATDQRPRRLVVLSDGLETVGHVLQAATVGRFEQAPIYAYEPPSTSYDDVAVTKVVVPQLARREEPASLRVGLHNASDQVKTIRLIVRGNDEVIFDERVRLPAGKHLVDVTARPHTLGTYRVDARIDVADDNVRANNAYASAFEVIGPPRVLLLSERRLHVPYVAQVLESRNIVVDVQDISGLPAALGPLTDYDAIIMANVPRTALVREHMALIKRYVQEFGGGLVVIGAGGNLGQEARAQTTLDSILPARWTLNAPQERQTQTRLSIMLVVDRSNSMRGERLALTKHGAVELVKQLDPADMMGVIAFDVQPYTIVPLQPVALVRQQIIDHLVRITPGGGTHFLPALIGAKNFITATDAVVKHILLLSDGNTQEPHSALYRRFAQECQEQNVTVSTMAIGGQFVNVGLLKRLAQATGGTFYHLQNEDEIPRVIVADTQQMLTRAPFAEGWYQPHIAQPHEILGDIREEQLPPLKGYLVMEPKDQSTVSLTVTSETDTEDPLLVHWPAGLGRVTMFASDAEARWSTPWVHWNQYQQFWRQVITWTMRGASLHELSARVALEGETPLLTVHVPVSERPVEQFTVTLIPLNEPTAGTAFPLTQVAGTQWRASLASLAPGAYQALFVQIAHGELVGEARRWIRLEAPSASGTEETPAAPPNTALLTAMAERSGGRMGADADTIIGEHPTQRVVQQWDMWLVPIFLLLFLVDVALRGETML